MLTNAMIAQRLRQYMEHEQISKEYLADCLEKAPSSIYRLLNEGNSNIATFSMRVAEALQLKSNYFLQDEFYVAPEVERANVQFSKGELSSRGEADVRRLLQICDVLALYRE